MSVNIIKNKQIITIGGGILRLGETLRIDRYILKQSKKKHPCVLFLPTASNDLEVYKIAFENAYRKLGARVITLELLKKRINQEKINSAFLWADIIYIGGGDADLLMRTIKKNKLKKIFSTAASHGIILSGLSAGSVVWYEYFLENKGEKWYLKKGIGFLKGVNLCHFDRKLAPPKIMVQKAIRLGKITAIQNNCAVHYYSGNPKKVISSRKTNSFTLLLKNGKVIAEKFKNL